MLYQEVCLSDTSIVMCQCLCSSIVVETDKAKKADLQTDLRSKCINPA